MHSPVPWPDPTALPPPGWSHLAWGEPLSETPSAGRAFGGQWRIAAETELGALALLRLTSAGGPRRLDARALAALGYRRVDEGLLALETDGTRIECDLLDEVITLTEAP